MFLFFSKKTPMFSKSFCFFVYCIMYNVQTLKKMIVDKSIDLKEL